MLGGDAQKALFDSWHIRVCLRKLKLIGAKHHERYQVMQPRPSARQNAEQWAQQLTW
jgi:hypothetical protein